MSMPIDWWESTGFLYGHAPSLSPENPHRISSNVPQLYREQWRSLAPGFFTEAPSNLFQDSEYQQQELHGVPLWQVDVPDHCKSDCTLGGCSDPTSAPHKACVAAGCCGTPELVVTPEWSSQIAYTSTDCLAGPRVYCQSNLAYKQCNPVSTLLPSTDSECVPFRPCGTIPWASVN